MTVAQSAIVTAWFKGKELSTAFGINLSVARVGSFVNGPVESIVAQNSSVGNALLVGFFICLFSLATAIVLVVIDAWAEKKDNVKAGLSEEDKFKFSDLKEFISKDRLPFWLITSSCIIIYMVIFTYIGNGADMLTDRFGFTKTGGASFYATPYVISAFASPILGFVIDKIGKRSLFIASSSILIFLACLATIFITPHTKVDDKTGNPNYAMLIPLGLLGIGYSVYAAALWGCIPYTVPPKLIGSAFGLCTACQNIGLTVSPLIAGPLLSTQKEGGYFWTMVYFCVLSCIGFLINMWIYFDDLKYRGGVLDKVDKGDAASELEGGVENFMQSPTMEQRRRAEEDIEKIKAKNQAADDDAVKAGLLEYKTNKAARDSLRRSVGGNAANPNR